MGVDQARHDQVAARVDAAVWRVFVDWNIAHLDDFSALDVDTAVVDKAIFVIERHQVSIGDQQRTHRSYSS